MHLHFCLYAFGKLKTPGLREASDYYQRIIQAWSKLEEIELKPLSVPEKSPESRRQIQEKEGLILLNRLKEKSKTPTGGRTAFLLLDETGKVQSTKKWAESFQQLEDAGFRNVAFCIGSSLGFSKEVRQQAQSQGLPQGHATVSFGPQTLSHELARIVLLEQIYRALSVIHGHPYHVEG